MFSFFFIVTSPLRELPPKLEHFYCLFLAENPVTVLFMPFAIKYGAVLNIIFVCAMKF